MRRFVNLCVLALSLGLLAACSGPAGQSVSFKPDLKVAGGNIGRGKTVALRVVDARPDKIIGYRDMDMGKNAPIRAEGDLTETIGLAASRALADLGFTATSYSESAGRSLTVTIRDLGYGAQSQNVTKKVNAKCVLQAKAKNGPGAWEGSFPVRQEKDVVMTPDENANARFINEVLSESLTLIFSDPELQQFLAKDGIQSKTIKQD